MSEVWDGTTEVGACGVILFAHPPRGTCFPECPWFGYCHCGCGTETVMAICNRAKDGPKRGRSIRGHYSIWIRGHNALGHGNYGPGAWMVNGVPVERIQPLLDWLISQYGEKRRVAGVLGVPDSTLAHWCDNSTRAVKHIPKDRAMQIARVVQAHRSPRSSPFDDDIPRRLPTQGEATMMKRRAQNEHRTHFRGGPKPASSWVATR